MAWSETEEDCLGRFVAGDSADASYCFVLFGLHLKPGKAGSCTPMQLYCFQVAVVVHRTWWSSLLCISPAKMWSIVGVTERVVDWARQNDSGASGLGMGWWWSIGKIRGHVAALSSRP